MVINQEILKKTQQCLTKLLDNNLKISIAESCSGGLLSFLFTYFPGSSKILECSFVTYSNNSKIKILNVDQEIIDKHGAVSSQTAVAMAAGALNISQTKIAIATTGIAGPSGATDSKPVGLVYISCLLNKQENSYRKFNFHNQNRNEIQLNTANAALDFILDRLNNISS